MTAMYETGLDVVIVNYRTPRDADRFLDSFEKFAPTVPWSLTFVNVAPLVGDTRVGDRAALIGTTIAFEENVGYNRAVNAAAAGGNRHVLVAFNADVVITEGALDECYTALVARDDWGVLGPRQTDSKGRITAAGIFGTLAAPKHRGWMVPDSGQFSDVRDDCVTVAGSAFFIKRHLWDVLTECPSYRAAVPDAAGAFLGSARGYFGETFAAYHAIAHGAKLAYLGTTWIRHEWHQSSPQGGFHEQNLEHDRAVFRAALDAHDPCIEHD